MRDSRETENILVSVLTPSWNRDKYLARVYRSICESLHQKIEWIVVDDASTDDTYHQMCALIEEAKYPVTYARFSKRVGKCKADNLLIDLAKGEFIVWCDSDDALTPHALHTMLATWQSIPSDEQCNFIGIAGMCSDKEGNIQSTGAYPFDQLTTTWLDLDRVYGRSGDMCLLIRRDVIGSKRFPLHDLVMTESGFWKQFMHMHINCISSICKIVLRNTQNRISGSRLMEYCRGKAYSIIYAESSTYHRQSFGRQIDLGLRYHRYCAHGDIGFLERNRLFNGRKPILYYLLIVPATILAVKDVLQGRVVKTHKTFELGLDATTEILRNFVKTEYER